MLRVREAAAPFRAAVHRALAPPEMTGDVNRRFVRLGHWARLACAAAAIVAIPLLGGLSTPRRFVLVGVVAALYLPSAMFLERRSARRPRVASALLTVGGDLGVVFAFTLLAPAARTAALLVYVLIVALNSFLGGVGLGVTVAVSAAVLALTAELVPGPGAGEGRDVGGFALAMFVTVAVILAAMIETATGERRRTARFLTRLQRAVAGVPATPDLAETLRSVCRVTRAAVDAKFVSVLVSEAGGITQAALEGDIGADPPERSSEMIARILREPDASPSGIALTRGETVVVPVIADDPRFARWIDETRRQGFTSTIAVPLRTGDRVIGVVASYFSSPDLVTQETVELLGAYADHVAVVILRALAYEHEKRAASRLAEADTLKADLVATVSHELRTPLTSVKGFIETVLRHWERFDDPERRELLERALRNADQLAGLIDQVLDFSRLEAGTVVTAAAPLALEREVRRALEQHPSVTENHPVEIDVDPALRVTGDPEGFARVFGNLASNAGKYAPTGTTIRISAERKHDEVVVSVADEGPGVPPGEQDMVFERFYRVTPGQGPRGTGIGLAIVKRYVELMGGRVWVESLPGRGSTFRFALPAAPGDHAPAAPRAMNAPRS